MTFLVKCVSVIVRMMSVNKKYLSENEIVELLNVDSDSICSESSVEVFSENDSDPEFIPDCNETSGKFLFTLSNLFIHFMNQENKENVLSAHNN